MRGPAATQVQVQLTTTMTAIVVKLRVWSEMGLVTQLPYSGYTEITEVPATLIPLALIDPGDVVKNASPVPAEPCQCSR
jgi:hypothetical protein